MATAIAPANIAFIKYWGMRDRQATLPYNGSISMNLDRCYATTTVEFDPRLNDDEVTLTFFADEPRPATGRARERVVAHLDRLRHLAGEDARARVVSQNNFPADAGIASSAAGFAALTLAAVAALDMAVTPGELSQLARLSGSGSACRSIPDGFVEWVDGDTSTSVAHSIAPPSHWALADIVAVVDTMPKKTGSAENHHLAATSPYFKVRLEEVAVRLAAVRQAIAQRDIELLGTVTEADAISMHVVCMTQQPPSFYWTGGTFDVLHAVQAWRAAGIPAYVTMDAGANVHVICEADYHDMVVMRLNELPAVQFTLSNAPGAGARLVPADNPATIAGS